jgi:alpha-D-xyloside xylohydrolase
MRFTNGFWLMRDGVKAHYGKTAHRIDRTSEGLTIYAPSKVIEDRGDTLNLPVITTRLHSPMKNIIGFKVSHHEGGVDKGPHFELTGDGSKATVKQSGEKFEISSGEISAHITKGELFDLEVAGSQGHLTRISNKGIAWINDNGSPYINIQLNLAVGELIYGLGEHFTPFVKNGQSIDIWNEDGGTASEQAYKNIPFYLTNRGYGIFINHTGRVSLEIGTEVVDKVQITVPGEELEIFFIYGANPREIIKRYTDFLGKPALPPEWSYGLWLSTSFTTNYDEQTVNSFLDGMAEREIPVSAFHFDTFWMKEFSWSSFQWDKDVFPDPANQIKRLHEKGYKVCLWTNPYIAQMSEIFDEAKEAGYLLKRPDGSVWQWDLWQAGMGIVDFTNPAARTWYQSKLQALLDIGVDTFKTDFGERIPTDVIYFDGSDPVRMHNYYTYIYNKTVFELLERKENKEAVVFARSATAGSQKFPIHWGGDNESTFESMAGTLRGGLSMALSGFGFWSHDIGGFEGTPNPDVFKRWLAFGLLSSHSRLHGSASYRVPWLIDDESSVVTKFFTDLKTSLMPYILKMAKIVHIEGIPMMRPMMMEFPDDPSCEYLDRQYMLGDSILVAPIFNSEGVADFYLPQGSWVSLISGEKVEGGSWRSEKHGYLSLPLYLRSEKIAEHGTELSAVLKK